MTNRKKTFLGVAAAFVLIPESFVGPVLVLFYTKSLGLSFQEMTQFFSLILLAKGLTEIPAGLLSDRYGRKAMLVLGEALTATAMLGLLLLPGSKAVLLGLGVLWGLGNSLSSGNLYPIVQDALASMGLGDHLPKVISYGQAASYLAMFAASIAAGYIGEIDLSLPFKIDIAILIAYTLIVGACLPNSSNQQQGWDLVKSLKCTLKNMNFRQSKWLFVILFMGALAPAIERSNFNFFQPILTAAGFEIRHLGYLSSGMFLIGALGGFAFGKSSSNSRMKNGLIWFCCLLCLTAALSSFFGIVKFSGSSILLFSANALLVAIFGIAVTNSILSIVGPEHEFRTTIFSVLAFLSAIFSAVLQTATGYWQQYLPQSDVVALCTLAMGLSVITYQLIGHSAGPAASQQ